MCVIFKCLVVISFTFWSGEAQHSPQWRAGDDGRIQWDHDCDFVGQDLGNVRSKTEDCGGLCFQMPECTRFLWTNENGGTCHFKSGNEQARSRSGDGAVCGYVTAEKINRISWQKGDGGDVNRIRWAHNCDFTGLIIDTVKVPGFLCGAACLNVSNCIGFVFTEYEGGTCWLKSRGHPIPAYTGPGGVCGEIIFRRASYGPSNGESKRKSELACEEYKEIGSHFQIGHGEPSEGNEFPWMAALGYRITRDVEFRCSGTIISDYHVLTAARCMEPQPVIVQLGTHVLNDANKVNVLIESCINHERFSSEEHKNDIALIKLKERITFTNRIRPACLRTNRNDLPWNEELVATGWRKTKDGRLSDTLKKASLQTVELRSCQAEYLKRGSEPKNRIIDNQYCAADPEHKRDTCPGDSGGPIQMFDNYSPLATVVGIASFGTGCPSALPGVYTRVASFLDWIEDRVWKD